MNRTVKIIIDILIWGGLLAYLIWAATYCSAKMDENKIHSVRIDILDADSITVVDAFIVRSWLEESDIKLEGEPVEKLDTEHIRQLLQSRTFIKNVQTFTNMEGELHIMLTQRSPIMRFTSSNGYDCYISDDLWALPTGVGNAQYVPIITGDYTPPFEAGYYGPIDAGCDEEQKKDCKNYLFLHKLINFVKLIRSDAFWNAQIVQINLKDYPDSNWKEPEVELVPRVGSHFVVFGSLDYPEEKLEKLMLFYQNVLDYEGWDKYKVINVSYKDQVVCTNK